MEYSNIKGIIFDYGGTIDSRGDHWSHIIYEGWQKSGLEVPIEIFRDAYVNAERALARERHILPSDNFLQLLRKKMLIELTWLSDNTEFIAPGDIETKADEISLY